MTVEERLDELEKMQPMAIANSLVISVLFADLLERAPDPHGRRYRILKKLEDELNQFAADRGLGPELAEAMIKHLDDHLPEPPRPK